MWAYNVGVFLYWGMLRTASLFHPKAKLWVRGRKNCWEHIEKVLKEKKLENHPKVYWFHCASLGEFEQGRPVMENLKTRDKEIKIVLTFFSPSGYEVRKDYEYASAVFYLPIDFKRNAKKFISLVKPRLVIFVKYEFWLNYLAELREKNIPTYLISAVFRKNQHFFKSYGNIFFNSLNGYKKIYLQDENSFRLLHGKGLSNIEVAGDTRFDRVMQVTKSKTPFAAIDRFCGNAKVLIAGSTWPKDSDLMLAALIKLRTSSKGIKLILVPHEVDVDSIEAVEKQILNRDPTLFFARLSSKQNFERHDILIIDTIGMLSQVYRYATVAYVGGGFNDGIHSILEALAHEVPVAFGPNNEKFVEAAETIGLEIGKEIHNEAELLAFFSEMISNDKKRTSLALKIEDYMRSKTGASEKICRELMSVAS